MQELREYAVDDVSIRMEHVRNCFCRYVASAFTGDDVKLIDTRCIAAYLVPNQLTSE